MRNHHRIQQSRRELRRLREETEVWFGHCDRSTRLEAHRSHLLVLRTVLSPVFDFVESSIEEFEPSAKVGQVYDDCRLAEDRINVIRRYVAFFADKLQQRDAKDPRSATIRAADEVIWSCWAEPFRRLGSPETQPPAPLAYVASVFVPSARLKRSLPTELSPADLKLQRLISSLPFATISLPERSIGQPWFVALVAHEVGHLLQHELAEGELLSGFENCLGDFGSNWAGWSEEVFADLVAVLALGPASIPTLEELVLTTPEAMAVADDQYPAPDTRLELMRAWMRQLEGVTPGTSDLVLEGLAHRTLNVAIRNRTVRSLYGWNMDATANRVRFASCRRLACDLEKGEDVACDTTVRGARNAAAAAVIAFGGLQRGAAETGTTERLAASATSLIACCRENVVRSGVVRDDLSAVSAAFIDELQADGSIHPPEKAIPDP